MNDTISSNASSTLKIQYTTQTFELRTCFGTLRSTTFDSTFPARFDKVLLLLSGSAIFNSHYGFRDHCACM
jgi:hypothetical protein